MDDHPHLHLVGPSPETPVPDLIARRPEVIRRLLALGVPAQTLRTLLPDWDVVVAEALSEPEPAV